MNGEPGPHGAPHPATDEHAPAEEVLGFEDLDQQEREASVAWMSEHLQMMRQSAYGQRVMYWILGTGFVVGLAAHIGGFLLKDSATAEPLALVADLLYALGFALWTGVVVVIFVQIWPDAKKRQFKEALDAYEAVTRRREARVGSGRAPDPGSP